MRASGSEQEWFGAIEEAMETALQREAQPEEISTREVMRVKSALRELERKTFHLCGLLVPLIHLALLEGGFRQRTCILMAWAITSIGWSADLARLHIPFVARHWPLQTILRDHEREPRLGPHIEPLPARRSDPRT